MSFDLLTFPSVSYQIYPRSFAAVEPHAGMGNLAGITGRLQHLSDLGIEMFWISPFFPSPDYDQGYDVMDHTAVDPRLGTVEEFDELVEEAHALGLRVLLDFIPNHVSIFHRWFQESLDPASSYRDWFYWRKPKPDGSPFNNYTSPLLPLEDGSARSAWCDDPSGRSDEQYLSLFFPEQADLNWNNPEVVEAQLDVLRFWLGHGADGFRIDVAHTIAKLPDLPDHPYVPGDRLTDVVHSLDNPEIAKGFFSKMRDVCEEFGEDKVLVGEVLLRDAAKRSAYQGDGVLDSTFVFALQDAAWSAEGVGQTLAKTKQFILDEGKIPTWVLGNHDVERISARAGSERRALALTILTMALPGNTIVYQGDEVLLPDLPMPIGHTGDWRGGGRARIPWDPTDNAGWPSGGDDGWWIPLAPDHQRHNAEIEQEDPASPLSVIRSAIAFRNSARPVNMEPVEVPDATIVGWMVGCSDGEDRLLLCNFSESDVAWPLLEDAIVDMTSDRESDSTVRQGIVPAETAIFLRLAGKSE